MHALSNIYRLQCNLYIVYNVKQYMHYIDDDDESDSREKHLYTDGRIDSLSTVCPDSFKW